MGTVILYTLRESFHRRMAIALLVVSLLVVGVFFWIISFQTQPDGSVSVLLRGRLEGPADKVAEALLLQQLSFAAGPWLLLGLFACAPLLTSHLEKGWAELLLSKGVPRWQMFLGRYLGALAMFGASLLLLIGIPALQFWIGAGVAPGRVVLAAGVILFNYATLLALMATVAVALPNPAALIMLGFLQTFVANLLAGRKDMLYDVITARWAQWLIDWTYRILPKTAELNRVASRYYRTGEVDWWPLWSSALFLAGALALALWLFRRKDF